MKSKNWKKLLSSLFLILFIGYQGTNTIFMHTHQEGNYLITHSHPYGKNTPHAHSLGDFSLIHALAFVAIFNNNPWQKNNTPIFTTELIRPQHRIGRSILKNLYTIGFRAPPIVK